MRVYIRPRNDNSSKKKEDGPSSLSAPEKPERPHRIKSKTHTHIHTLTDNAHERQTPTIIALTPDTTK